MEETTKTGTFGEAMMLRYTVAEWILLAVEDLVVCFFLAMWLFGGFILVRALLARMGLSRAGKKELKVVAVLCLVLAQGTVAHYFVTQIMPDDGYSLDPAPALKGH